MLSAPPFSRPMAPTTVGRSFAPSASVMATGQLNEGAGIGSTCRLPSGLTIAPWSQSVVDGPPTAVTNPAALIWFGKNDGQPGGLAIACTVVALAVNAVSA